MTRPTTTVLASFSCLPGHQDAWLATWRELAEVATELPACHELTLLQNRTDPTRLAVLSRWDDASAFHRFVRTVGLIWRQRVTDCRVIPDQIAYFDTIPDELVRIMRTAAQPEAVLRA